MQDLLLGREAESGPDEKEDSILGRGGSIAEVLRQPPNTYILGHRELGRWGRAAAVSDNMSALWRFYLKCHDEPLKDFKQGLTNLTHSNIKVSKLWLQYREQTRVGQDRYCSVILFPSWQQVCPCSDYYKYLVYSWVHFYWENTFLNLRFCWLLSTRYLCFFLNNFFLLSKSFSLLLMLLWERGKGTE